MSFGFFLIEEEEKLRRKNVRSIRRNLRDVSNPLELPQELFIKTYRVNKPLFTYLLEVLDESLPMPSKSFGVGNIVKLCACLRFLAEGGYQRGVGKDYEVGLAQSSMSEALSSVLKVFEEKLCPQWIQFPTASESSATSFHFYEKFKLPGVIGAIDGTHVQIIAPKTSRHLYYNRNGTYSLNVLLVCDEKMSIRFVDATHPGACHDALIWKVSQLRSHLERKYLNGERNAWLLGDKGYPLMPWLMTPHRACEEGTPEFKFNKAHKAARKIIERVNGALKGRWRCIIGARELHYEPTKAVRIVNVCCALHNLCIHYNIDWPIDQMAIDDIDDSSFEPQDGENDAEYLAVAQRIRFDIGNSL